MSGKNVVKINRAPVLTLWAAVVAERLGFKRDEALSLGKTVAGLNAQSKGRRLGIFKPTEEQIAEARKRRKAAEESQVNLLGRAVSAINTEEGIRALNKDKPVEPESVERYLDKKFGDRLGDIRAAMADLAAAMDKDDLAKRAYGLYEQFRPEIPSGKTGWGAAGDLDLEKIRSLAG